MKFLDRDHPFFASAVTRWLTAILSIGWGLFEFSLGHPGWGILFLGAGAWAGYELLIRK